MVSKKFFGLLLLLSFPSLGFFQADALSSTGEDQAENRYKNLELFNRVLHLVETSYYKETKSEDLIYGAIRGMLETLDPHSAFLGPDIYNDFKRDTKGQFGGLGIEVTQEDGLLMVISPIDDTPAMEAGLQAGDRIMEIDEKSTKGMSLQDAVKIMRGPTGSKVELAIWRPGEKKWRRITITRELIKVVAVKKNLLEPGYGYLRLSKFQQNAASQMKKAIGELEKKKELQGLILDLRFNPGGLLDQAVEVANLFIDEGAIVSTRTRDPDVRKIRYAKKGLARTDFPLVVLVNGSSASAAEIVAGALKDHRRALVMGEKTFGKGSVQTVIEMGEKVALKLTVAQYYTPNDISIQAKGIEPDIRLVNYDPDKLEKAKIKVDWKREKDLDRHLENGEDKPADSDRSESEAGQEEDEKLRAVRRRLDPSNDPQVAQALRYLKSHQLFEKLRLGVGEAKSKESASK